jgi:hypothetical protein
VCTDQPRTSVSVLYEQRRRRPAGEEVRSDTGCEHRLPTPERLLPEGRVEERHLSLPGALLVAAPGVVDEQIEPALLAANACEERLDLVCDRVVASNGHRRPATLFNCGRRLLERPLPAGRRGCPAHAPAGEVDSRARLAEHEADRPASAAARSGYDRDHFRQINVEVLQWGRSRGYYSR